MALAEGAGVEEGFSAKGNFTMPKCDGLFANKGGGLGTPSASDLRVWWIRSIGPVL